MQHRRPQGHGDNLLNRKTAFIPGASRGIGAEAAVALAQAGYDLAITARTLAEGERHDHVGDNTPLPGSLEATAAAIRARSRVSSSSS